MPTNAPLQHRPWKSELNRSRVSPLRPIGPVEVRTSKSGCFGRGARVFSHQASFSVNVSQEDGSLVLFLTGELDLATAPILAQAVNELIEAHTWSVMLDLGGVSFVDVVGLRAISDIRQTAVSSGLLFRLCSVSDSTRRVIRLADHVKLETSISIAPGATAA